MAISPELKELAGQRRLALLVVWATTASPHLNGNKAAVILVAHLNVLGRAPSEARFEDALSWARGNLTRFLRDEGPREKTYFLREGFTDEELVAGELAAA